MKRVSYKIVLVFFLFLLTVPQESFPAEKVKTIAVFFSLNETTPAYQNILEGFHSVFPESLGEPYNLLIEYLDVGRTENDAPISTTFALNKIANQCKAPLFSMSDNFIKKVGIGGRILSFTEVVKEAGRVAVELIKGKPVNEIVLIENDFYKYIYNWKELKRWNLLHSKAILPSSMFINKKVDFLSEYRWFILTILMFLIAQTILIMCFYRINKRQKETVRQKSEIDHLYRELTREDRLSKMSELTASLSHELNQPLTAILYNAQAGMRFLNSDKLDKLQAKEIFGNIIEDEKRASGLISSIRNLMKLESREKEEVNLNSLIIETIKIFNFEAIQHNIKIKFLPLRKPAFVYGDKIQLQQVILNFLSNAEIALKNIDADRRLIEISQKLHTSSVTVSVQDSGPGINNDIRDKIFKPFVTTRKNGFGIGLAISNTIIERHEGNIWAENIDGGGAKFSFTLPIVNK